jgi:hypothetical protein
MPCILSEPQIAAASIRTTNWGCGELNQPGKTSKRREFNQGEQSTNDTPRKWQQQSSKHHSSLPIETGVGIWLNEHARTHTRCTLTHNNNKNKIIKIKQKQKQKQPAVSPKREKQGCSYSYSYWTKQKQKQWSIFKTGGRTGWQLEEKARDCQKKKDAPKQNLCTFPACRGTERSAYQRRW